MFFPTAEILKILKRLETRMTALDDAITKLTGDDSALSAEVQQVITYLGTIPGQITAAVNAALQAGASATQLAALAKVSTDIEATVTTLTAAAAAAPQPAAAAAAPATAAAPKTGL